MNAKAVTTVLFCCLFLGPVAQASEHWVNQDMPPGRVTGPRLDKGPGVPPPDSPVLTGGDCSDYIDLTGQPLPIVATGSTFGAANDYGPFPMWPDCWTGWWYPLNGAASDVTYKWTVPSTGSYTISLAGSSYDTVLLLYDFTCPVEPVYPDDFICGNDDWPYPDAELYSMPFEAGDEILIVVDGAGSASGDYRLTISEYELAADLDAFIAQTMESAHIPGLSACAIYDGEIIRSGSYGLADIENGVAVTDTTLFLMASISKTITGVALMQLWEDGLLGLDVDVNDYLDFEVNNPFCPDSAITSRMLLSHTSSIDDNWTVLNPLIAWGGDSPIPLHDFVRGYLEEGGTYYTQWNYKACCPVFIWDYCNVGIALAGHLVEAISGIPFESYCQDSLFVPLGMDDTSFHLANLDSSDVAVPYRWDGMEYVRYPHYGHAFYPASHLRTSMPQLARFLTAFMQCGELGATRILDCPTVELMTTWQYTDIMWGQGLVWYVIPLGGRQLWGHTGSWHGCRTAMFYCPEENSGVIVLTNGESGIATQLIMHEIFEWIRATTSVPGITRALTAQQFTLEQNRPNPFNPSTVLDYSLSQPDRVTLAIYNMLGRRVATLYDGPQEAGQHRVTWDASGFSSGPYFARIASQGEVKTIKLVLAR